MMRTDNDERDALDSDIISTVAQTRLEDAIASHMLHSPIITALARRIIELDTRIRELEEDNVEIKFDLRNPDGR